MGYAVVGLLHPGEMGAALGASLRSVGHQVLWASFGRGPETTRRADRAGLEDVGTIHELAQRSTVIFSVCPPHVAFDVARSVNGFGGVFVDANAVSPALTSRIGELVEQRGCRYVDGGIVGPPPTVHGTTRLYLSGSASDEVAALFEGSVVEARVLSELIGAASALKMAYAAWTKGTTALVLAIRALARAKGVEEALREEWLISQPDLVSRSAVAARSAAAKGWRWVGEMDEIAETFSAAGLPDGFHRAAAAVFGRVERGDRPDDQVVDLVLGSVPTGEEAQKDHTES